MVQGTGISMVEIVRIKRVLERRASWLCRWFCEEEMTRSARRARPEEELAGRFACKTAVRAALQSAIGQETWIALYEVVTLNDALGKPLVRLDGAALALMNRAVPDGTLHVSITHARDYAAAIAVFTAGSWT